MNQSMPMTEEARLLSTVAMYRNGNFIDWQTVSGILAKPIHVCYQEFEMLQNGQYQFTQSSESYNSYQVMQPAANLQGQHITFNFYLADSYDALNEAYAYLDSILNIQYQYTQQPIPMIISMNIAQPDSNTYDNLDKFGY